MNRLIPFLMVAVFVVGMMPMAAHAQGTGTTTQVSNLSQISAQTQWITPDNSLSVAWISAGVGTSSLYEVNMATVQASPGSAVEKTVSPVFTNPGNGCGNPADGAAASVVLGGDLYVTGWFNNNCIGVAQVSESTGAVLNQWTYTNGFVSPTDARGIATDGTYLYVCTQFAILKLTTSGTFSVVHSISGDCYDLILSGSTVYFTENGHGAGQVNTDGTGFSEYSCSCTNGAFLVLQGGSLYVTDNQDHTLMQFTSGTLTHTYATGMASDGPYGLVYDSGNNGFWLSGYANNNIRFFALSNSSFVAAKDVSTTKKPFMPFVDGANAVWNMALGSTDLIKIVQASPSPPHQPVVDCSTIGVQTGNLGAPTPQFTSMSSTSVSGFLWMFAGSNSTEKSFTDNGAAIALGVPILTNFSGMPVTEWSFTAPVGMGLNTFVATGTNPYVIYDCSQQSSPFVFTSSVWITGQ